MKIKRVIDLTGENFDRINFEEAEILKFDFINKDINNIEFEIWGARLLVDNFWEHEKNFLNGVPHSDDYYVAGKGKIKIEDVTGIQMTFYPYDKVEIPSKFAIDETGKIIEKKWSMGKPGKGDHYLWECVLIYPYSFCKLNVFCNGKIKFMFDDIDMIFEKEYLNNPLKYSYHI